MDKFTVLSDMERVEYFHNSLERSVEKFLDDRESVLWDNSDLDVEVFREVSALYRVIKQLSSDSGIKPMPNIVKRMFYLKRHIYQAHRRRFEGSTRRKT